MSDPNDDSPNPASAPDPGGTDAQGNQVTRAPRANPASVFNPKDATPPQSPPPGFAEFMEWMKSMGGGPVEEESPRAGRSVLPKEQKKFVRRSAEAPKPLPPETDASSDEPRTSRPSGMVEEGAPPPRVRNILPEPYSVERKRRAKERPPKGPVSVLLTQFLVFMLIVGGFFLGRATVSRVPTVKTPVVPGATGGGKTPDVLPPLLAEKVDQAMQAETANDYQRAQALLEEVQNAGGQFDGLAYHRALLAYTMGDLPRVILLLNQSIANNEQVAACYNLRGTLNNREGGVEKGLGDLQLAAQLDPVNAKYAFFVGEALRRQGKPQAALGYLRQAVYRCREPGLENVYRLKIRLTQIELGQENVFASELATNLALNPPPVDWLFTAAAVELHRGNLATAAAFFDKAATLTTASEMNSHMRDYYFFAFADRKELARFFLPILQAAPAASASPPPPQATKVPPPAVSPFPAEPVPAGLPKLP